MNKKLFLLVAFVLSLGLGFTACGDDEKEDPAVDYAAQVAGTYNGELVVDLGTAGGEQDPITRDIKIARKADNSIELSLDDFIFMDMPVGDIKVSTAVSENEGVVKLADVTLSEYSLAEGALTADVKLHQSTVKNGKLILNISVTKIKLGGVEGTPDVEVSFTGDKK